APDASEAECEAILTRTLRDRYGLDVVVDGGLPAVRHVFSHLEWRLPGFAARVRPGAEAPAGRRELAAQGRAAGRAGDLVWAAPEELDGLAFGRAHRRIADTWRKRRSAPWRPGVYMSGRVRVPPGSCRTILVEEGRCS